jgi:hypothetical protein
VRLLRELARHIGGAVADADDQDPFALQVERLGRVDVVVRVDRVAGELTGEVRVARIPVVPVGHHQSVEAPQPTVLGA